VKTTGVGGAQRGYDGGKKVKGRKRHLVVDTEGTEGLVLKAKVHSAKVLDQEGIKPLLDGAKELFARLSHLGLDGGASVGSKNRWFANTPPPAFERYSSYPHGVVGKNVPRRAFWKPTRDARMPQDGRGAPVLLRLFTGCR
jgi:hypothetical protein